MVEVKKKIKESEAMSKEKIDGFERFKKVVVGRELKMQELKERIEQLGREKA